MNLLEAIEKASEGKIVIGKDTTSIDNEYDEWSIEEITTHLMNKYYRIRGGNSTWVIIPKKILNINWEVKTEYITWQKALEKLMSGKEMRYELEGQIYTAKSSTGFQVKTLQEVKWIKEEE